ncbi:type IV toxin-antitoxin system YeeU family antitoxin [Lelliottia jeotgali]|nr:MULTISPECIES: type IV toxin-antitoxin system YeeU family antitoxin [Lelliottia]
MQQHALFWRETGTGGQPAALPERPRSITGTFSEADLRHLDQAFPLLLKQLELMLTSDELTPRHQHGVTLYAKGLTCNADTLGSCGYVYIAIYPTPATTE